MNQKLKLVVPQKRALGTRLPRGDAYLTTRVRQLGDDWPKTAHQVFDRVRRAHRIQLAQLVKKDGYVRWTVRCLVKAGVLNLNLAKAA